MDVVLGEATAVQPDLILVLEPNADILKDVVRGVPDLAVEVLYPSTEKIDRGLKMETYARYGVGEYWIVDAERKTIEIYRLDRDANAYRLAATCRGNDLATTLLLPNLSHRSKRTLPC
jgi:Uma2 family endonuclease